MAIPLEIKSIVSPDLEFGALPLDPENCAILVEVEIGQRGKEGADIFYFTAVTPKFLVAWPEVRWGRGYLILPEFSWKEIERMLTRLLQSVRKDSWPEVAAELCKELNWEFENYQAYEG